VSAEPGQAAAHRHPFTACAAIGITGRAASSDLDDRTAENLSLLQSNASLLDLLQRISVGHQFPQRELVLAHPVQEKREVGLGFCRTKAPAIMALVEKN